MARFNEILVGRYNRFLQKLMSMKGGPVAAQLASEISATILLFSGAENRALETWNRYWASATSAAQAAINSAIQFRNLSPSAVVMVIEKLGVRTGTASAVNFSVQGGGQTAAFTNVFTGFRMDARVQNATSNMSVEASVGATADLPVGVYTSSTPAAAGVVDFILTINQEITLLPGDTLRIRDTTVNDTLVVSLMWRERSLEESERL